MNKDEFGKWYHEHKTNGNWFKILKTYYPQFFKELDEWVDGKPAEKAFLFLSGSKLRPLCICGRENKFYGKNGYAKRCSIQCSLEVTKSVRESKKKNHTSERRKQISEKCKATIINRYGEDHVPFLAKPRSKEFSQKCEQARKDTMYRKYGVTNPGELEETHLKRKETYKARSKDQREKTRLKNLETRIKNGNSLPNDHPSIMGSFKQYTRRIRYLTDMSVDKNEYLKTNRSMTLHIDHQFSIFDGFKFQIPPAIISHICNLRLLGASENSIKNRKSSITLEELNLRIRNYI